MKYKILVSDLDGTAVESLDEALPSPRLISAVKKAKELLVFSIATGRSFSYAIHILNALNITAPCVISGGSQIYDPVKKKIIWEKTLSVSQLEQVLNYCRQYPYTITLSDETIEKSPLEIAINKPETTVYIYRVPENIANELVSKINTIENTSANTGNSFMKGHVDINVTHKQATKKYAVKKLLEMLQLNEKGLIVVGDSNNDLPMFELNCFRVAMGNATSKMKTRADLIIDTQKNDGLAKFIEKYVIIPTP